MSLAEGVGWVALGLGAVIAVLLRVVEEVWDGLGLEGFSFFGGFIAAIAGAHLGWDPLLCTGGLVVLASTVWASHRRLTRGDDGWTPPRGRPPPHGTPPVRHREQ